MTKTWQLSQFCATLAALMTLWASAAGQQLIVSPGAYENTEAPIGTDTPIAPFRIQWLYPASDFDSISEQGAYILGHAIRADESETVFGTNTFANTRFTLSTTMEKGLSTSFDTNLGTNAKLVFEGTSSISYPVDGPDGGPNPFGAAIEYQSPFFYNPKTMGNLLLEQVTTSGNDTFGLAKDWLGGTGGNTIAYDLDDPLADFAAGLGDSIVVTRFTILPVPEPSYVVLLGTSVLMFSFRPSRRSR